MENNSNKSLESGNDNQKGPAINIDELPGSIIIQDSSSRKFSLGFFILIAFCFLLPFFKLSCGGTDLIVVSGIETVTGTNFESSEMFGKSTDNRKMDPELFAILALLCALGGIGFSFARGGAANLLNLLASIGGAVFLIVLKFKLDHDVHSSGELMIKIDYMIGYWLALLLFIGSALMHAMFVKRRS